jgi:hypothetical protein
MIPGAYDRTTLTHRQPGSMGGGAFGSAPIPTGAGSMEAATIAAREMEGGGGGVSERRRKALADEHNKSQSTGGRWWFQLLRRARPVTPLI